MTGSTAVSPAKGLNVLKFAMMKYFLLSLLYAPLISGQGGIVSDCDPTSEGSILCSSCPRGRFRGFFGGTQRRECVKCPRGRYGSMAGLESVDDCTECPLGKYNDKLGAETEDDCRLCPPGRIGESAGLTSKQCSGTCQDGYFSREFGLISDSECEVCPPNYRGWQCHEDVILRKGFFDSTSGHIGEEAHAYIGDDGNPSSIPQGASPIKLASFYNLPLDNLAASSTATSRR